MRRKEREKQNEKHCKVWRTVFVKDSAIIKQSNANTIGLDDQAEKCCRGSGFVHWMILSGVVWCVCACVR